MRFATRHGATRATTNGERAATTTMVSARDLLAVEERYESLTDHQKRCVIKCQAKMRGWAQRHKKRKDDGRASRAKGGVWALFSLNASETVVETYRAHLGGPIASGTGDLYVTSGHACFYCETSDATRRDGLLFSPSKRRSSGKPISLKIAYKEIERIEVRSEGWGESGVALTMRDGSSMWFGGFYFPSSVKALMEAEWTRETVEKLNHARALRTELIMARGRKRQEAMSASQEKFNALNDELRAEREKTKRAEARERDQIVEIEVLRENEERMERQKKKLVCQVRDYEEECESLRSKASTAMAARRAAEKKFADMEASFDKKIDDLLEEKNTTINELSEEVSKFKEMWQEDKAQMKAENEKARRSASELRDQRDALVSEKSKLVIELGQLESQLTKFSEVSAKESRRVCELEAELEGFRSKREDSSANLEKLQNKYEEAMKHIAALEASNEARSTRTATDAEMSVKITEIESLKAHVEALRGRLNKKVEDSATLRSKYDDAMNEIAELRAAVQEERTMAKPSSDSNISNDAAEMMRVKSDLETQAAEVKALQAQVDALRANLNDKTVSSAKLQVKYEEVKNALKTAREDKENHIETASHEVHRRETELKSALENKVTKIEALEAEIAALRTTRESSGAHVATLKAKYDEAKNQIATLRAEKEDVTKTKSAELNHRESLLRRELDAKSAKCDELQSEVDNLRTQREAAAVATATLQSKFEEAFSKLSEAKLQRDEDRANFARERKELESAVVDAKETSAAALQAVQSERESMRDAKEKSNMSLVALKAKLEDSNKQLAASKVALENAAAAREEALEKMHDAQRCEEATKVQLITSEKALVQRETEAKSFQMEITAFTAAAKSAEEREREARAELQDLRRQNEALVKEHGTLEGRSKALEEKADQLVQVEKEMSALKAELTATALQQEKWKQDVEYAKAEIERSRSKEEANNEKYLDMLKNMSEAEREAASARAAESVARDYASRSNETAKETQARELRMRDELATTRVAYETLSTEFRAKTEEFSREVSRLEKSVSDEHAKMQVLSNKLDEAREKISNLELLNIQATNKIASYKDTLHRQREETKKIWEDLQHTQADLDEKTRLLEREQTETRDMHMQKALEKQRSTAALLNRPAGGFGAVRQPLADANRGGSPLSGSVRALPSIRPIEEMLPSLARDLSGGNAIKAIAASPTPATSSPR